MFRMNSWNKDHYMRYSHFLVIYRVFQKKVRMFLALYFQKLQKWFLYDWKDEILLFVLNTEWPQSDAWLTRNLENKLELSSAKLSSLS